MEKHVGLTEQQAQRQLRADGENVTQQAKHTPFWKKFFAQFGDLLIVILLVAAALSFALALLSNSGEVAEPVIIVAIVIANALLGAVQEHRAEKSLNSLKSLTTPKTKVFRNGEVVSVDSRFVVRGDVCLFEAGDIVTADCTVRTADGLLVNQAALTGESLAAEKGVGQQIFSGSFVTKGRCTAKVFATGAATELGKIAGVLANSQATLTPLQQKLRQLSKVIGGICLAVCAVVLVLSFVKGLSRMQQGDTLTALFVDVFLTSVSLAVAAIPEGLPAVVTVVLAGGIEKMAAQNAVVKKLTAVEALGSATVICTDKTGTLTQNKMTLAGVFDGKRYIAAQNLSPHQQALRQFCWCCDAVHTAEGWLGDPTEIAVMSLPHDGTEAKKVFQLPFDSNRKLMTTVVDNNNKLFCVTKGSLEAMRHAHNFDKFLPMHKTLTKRGLRVLALCAKQVEPSFPRNGSLEQNLTLCALFALSDPPRQEAAQAVEQCKSAGIRPVMVTGDNTDTAAEVAKTVGILRSGDICMDGQTLSRLSQQQLCGQVDKISVYARVTPTDKLRIVQAWQQRGAVVAMTGDGVNDAPALKKADIGCAMGSGTEVAKEAADIILADDNFATIVKAVSLGRSVYLNIKKAVTYLLTCNIGEVLSVFLSLLMWNVSPLSAMQLLWVNLVTDGLPGLALGIYKQEEDVMRVAPKRSDETFFSGGGGKKIVFGGILFAIVTLCAFAIGSTIGYTQACTMAFLVLSLSQLFFVLAMRSKKSMFAGGSTPFMTASFFISAALVAAVAFVPPLQNLFQLVTLPLHMYLAAVALSLVPSLAREVALLLGTLAKKSKK